jgi:hypothetical protein
MRATRRGEDGGAEPPLEQLGAPEERRGDRRHLTILRVGKMIAGGAQELCLIRNISSGGLKARVYSPKSVGQSVSVELKSNQEIGGTVQWVSGADIGIQFHKRIDVEAVLANDELARGMRPRPPRLHLSTLAILRLRSELWGIGICDISQRGAKIEIDQTLAVGDEVVIVVSDFRPLNAVVRWSRGGVAGVEFKQMIPYGELSEWLSSLGRATGDSA